MTMFYFWSSWPCTIFELKYINVLTDLVFYKTRRRAKSPKGFFFQMQRQSHIMFDLVLLPAVHKHNSKFHSISNYSSTKSQWKPNTKLEIITQDELLSNTKEIINSNSQKNELQQKLLYAFMCRLQQRQISSLFLAIQLKPNQDL